MLYISARVEVTGESVQLEKSEKLITGCIPHEEFTKTLEW